jgi:alpha-beta hydrolase superfamily lysophospholipase
VAQIADAKRFFEAAGSADKSWDERAGAYHEPLSDPDWADVADAMSQWILARV